MKRTDVRRSPASGWAPGLFKCELDRGEGMACQVHTRWHGIALIAIAVGALSAGPVAGEDGVTLAALRITYERECNTRLAYQAFAARAERDRMPSAALAFQAAALGESVHAAQQALQLKRLGAEPTWRAKRVVVRTTKDNLCQGIADEVYENQYIYRQIVDQSRNEGQFDALVALNQARAAEATHAALFARVLQDLEPIETAAANTATPSGPRGKAELAYYVCMGDGSVFSSPICDACPVCGGSRDELRVMAVGHPQIRAALIDTPLPSPR